MLPSTIRTELYREMNNIVIDDCVSITGLSRDNIFLWHKNVVSYPDSGIVGGFHLKFVDMLDEEVK